MIALIIDDLASLNPWIPRENRIYGTAEIVEIYGRPQFRITPQTSWSWNIEGTAFTGEKFVTHKVEHAG